MLFSVDQLYDAGDKPRMPAAYTDVYIWLDHGGGRGYDCI